MTHARVLVMWLGLAACAGETSSRPVVVSAPASAPVRPRAEAPPALPPAAPVEITEAEDAEDTAAAGDEDGGDDADVEIVVIADDRDHDGDDLIDQDDRCPDAPEDRDGFEDVDGCPDPDVDVDPVLDVDDLCPDTRDPELEDLDGCAG
jgi:hypothetical protein